MFYGWVIVGVTFVALAFQAGFYAYSFSLFVLPWQEAFDADRAGVMMAMSGATFAGLVFSPMVGKAIDHLPARTLLACGAIVHAAGFWLMTLVSELWQLVLIYSVSMSLATLLLGTMTCSAVVSRWFTALRGKALGISAIGTSVGGMLFPVMVGHWISEEGWRAALEYLALANLLIMLPLILLLVRQPDAAPTTSGATATTRDWGLGAIIRERNFWSLVAAIGLLMAVYAAVLANLSPFGTSINLDLDESAQLISAVAVAGIIGKLLFGAASDKFSLKTLLWSAQAMVIISLLLMALMPEKAPVLVATIILGLAAGGLLPVWGAMIARVFGVASFGRVMGVFNPFVILLVIPAFTLAGYSFDQTGGYQQCFLIFAGALLLGMFALIPLQMPEAEAA